MLLFLLMLWIRCQQLQCLLFYFNYASLNGGVTEVTLVTKVDSFSTLYI